CCISFAGNSMLQVLALRAWRRMSHRTSRRLHAWHASLQRWQRTNYHAPSLRGPELKRLLNPFHSEQTSSVVPIRLFHRRQHPDPANDDTPETFLEAAQTLVPRKACECHNIFHTFQLCVP